MDKFIKKINTSPLIRKRITAGDNSMPHFPKTFGVPLKKLLEREDISKIPNVVLIICNFLLLDGIDTEGIFRVNGNTKAVESIKAMFEEHHSPSMSNCTDVHAVASVLKCFLRELPDGLVPEKITLQLFDVYSQNLSDHDACIDEFKIILRLLPDENFHLLKYLCHFLSQIVEKESNNKMDFKNLGIVFGPNIFKLSQGIEGFKMQTSLNNIFTILISNYKLLFRSSSSQRDVTAGSGYLMDTQLITQTLSTDGHKSSPSLSGDFDLSSSNDNHLYSVPPLLPLPSVSSDLQRVISSCVDSHLSLGTPQVGDDLEHTSATTITTTNSVTGTTNTAVASKAVDAAMMDDMLPDWQAPNNMIDLDDMEGGLDAEMVDNTKENSSGLGHTAPSMRHHRQMRLSSSSPQHESPGGSLNYRHASPRQHNSLQQQQDRRLSAPTAGASASNQDLHDRMVLLRAKLHDFEESFERQHGCRPQLERSGNTQVQEWLAELIFLKERLAAASSTGHSSSSAVGPADGGSHYDCCSMGGDNLNSSSSLHRVSRVAAKSSSMLHASSAACPAVSSTAATASSSGISSLVDAVDGRGLSVAQFLDHLTAALHSQRLKNPRPSSLSDMNREQYEDEKVDLQKCLLHFEKIYGRPRDHAVKQIMKPLYDRYRLVKRYMKSAETGGCKVRREPATEQCGGSSSSAQQAQPLAPPLPAKSVALSISQNCSYIDNRVQQQYQFKLHNSGSPSAITAAATTTAGSAPSTANVPSNPPTNLKLRYNCATMPAAVSSSIPAENFSPPVHSKSFNSSVNDLMPFRSCSTMKKEDMDKEREVLLVEKRRLQKLLKDFEHGLERMTGRKVEKSDRDHMRPEYDRYKTIKCRLRLLDKELESP